MVCVRLSLLCGITLHHSASAIDGQRERERDLYLYYCNSFSQYFLCFSATVCRCPWLVAEELKVDVLI